MSQANIGGWKAALGDGGTPTEAFTDIEEVISVTGFGAEKSLEQVTNFDSPEGEQEYIGGLRDGNEITIECNYVPGAAVQTAMVAACEGDNNVNIRLSYIRTDPAYTFTFNAVPKTWTINPSPTTKNSISFVVKVSGGIARAGGPTPP